MQKYEDEDEWKALVGQPENLRTEFKSGQLLKPEAKNQLIEKLSKATSAFANTEGGVIWIGVKEQTREDKSRYAGAIDGGLPGVWTPEELEMRVASNLHPPLPGIRVFHVDFSGANKGKVGFAVVVPQGSTAYQANDCKYYGRSEFSNNALYDHEVRLRMMRGRAAKIRLSLKELKLVTAAEINESRRRSHERESISRLIRRRDGTSLVVKKQTGPPPPDEVHYDECEMTLAVINDGELTVSDFVLELDFGPPIPSLEWVNRPTPMDEPVRFRFAQPIKRAEGDVTVDVPRPVLFPGDKVAFPPGRIAFRLPEGQDFLALQPKIKWKAFMDNSPPCGDTLDLAEQRAASRGAAVVQ